MKLLHLYHDIMNLYGEYANISAMERILKKSGIECQTDKLSIGDNAELSEYDFIYIGSGTERNQKTVLEDFHKYTVTLKSYIDSGKVILMTGNSFEMLGSRITDASGAEFEGIGIADFSVKEQNKKRNTSDAIFKADFSDKELVGFINKCSEIFGIDTPLFDVLMGLGNKVDDDKEGIRINNLFGTHLTGPILIKNPYFLEYIANLVAGKKKEISTKHLGFEKTGYEVTLNALRRRAGAVPAQSIRN